MTPGPGVVYIVGRTLAQGRRAGLTSVAGVACGNLLNATGAALGLAALFEVSGAAFLVVKYAGAAWLVWLGVRMLRQAARDRRAAGSADEPLPMPPISPGRHWRDGLLVALLNPKTTLFFAAFLPQFMDLRQPALPQTLMLGALFVVVAACTDTVYVMLASAWSDGLPKRRSTAGFFGRFASGALLIALGVLGALTGSRRPA